MNNKTLEHGTLGICLVGLVVAVLTTILLQWTMMYVRQSLGITTPLSEYNFTTSWCLALALGNCFFSKLPYTGIGVSISNALGYTIGIALYATIVSIEVLVVSFISFMLVEYYSGIVRVKRLKKNSYVEQVNSKLSR